MYYLKNRYYDPRRRRFICADSLKALKAGEDFGGKNLYVYCNGNPVAMLDDEGEFAISLVKMAVGAVVNVATTYIAAKVTGQEYGILDGVAAAAVKTANQKKRWMSGRIIAYVRRYYPKTGITKWEPVYLGGYYY